MLITDAQVHLWEPDGPDRRWPKPTHQLQRPPHRANGFSPEEMLLEMKSAGVDRAIVVPPKWIGEKQLKRVQFTLARKASS
jgi:L-fuconolactonase